MSNTQVWEHAIIKVLAEHPRTGKDIRKLMFERHHWRLSPRTLYPLLKRMVNRGTLELAGVTTEVDIDYGITTRTLYKLAEHE